MDSRPSRDEALMDTARVWAKRGTCSRLQVGAVFSRSGRILTTGYNGVPAGLQHCSHDYWPVNRTLIDEKPFPPWVKAYILWKYEQEGVALELGEGDYFYLDNGVFTLKRGSDAQIGTGCSRAGHAERNGIDFAAKHGIELGGSEVHVTHMPCLACATSLINVGVERVRYSMSYRIEDGVKLLQDMGIDCLPMPGHDRVGA